MADTHSFYRYSVYKGMFIVVRAETAEMMTISTVTINLQKSYETGWMHMSRTDKMELHRYIITLD